MKFKSICSTLENDSTGKIKRLENYDVIKDWINLYLDILLGEVPFSIFGNTIILALFKSNSQENIMNLVNNLIRNVTINFGITVIDYDIEISDSNIKLTLHLSEDQDLDFTIAAPSRIIQG